jgi:hypothetical protein
MLRCVACQSYRDVRLVETVPFCGDCREADLPDELSCGFSPLFDEAIAAEQVRRLHDLPVQQTPVDEDRFRPAENETR